MNRPSPRSYLFVPATRPERIDKAFASGADAVIVDLEDAVAAHDKAQARDRLAHWLDADRRLIAVRINGADTEWFDDDLRLCAHPNVAAVMLPKAANPDEIHRCASQAPQARILPLVENAAGFDALRPLGAARNVERFVFGTIDFQLDLGLGGDGDEILYFRSMLVLASRLANLGAPIDGVTTEIADTAVVRADAARARRLGFGGKLCIHPAQVSIVNAAFSPGEAELAWAHRVLAAAETSRGAAISVDGKMVDKPVIDRARALIERAEVR